MKKLLLTVTAVAGLAFVSNAQEFGFDKGNFIVEGSFQSSNTNDKNTKEKESAFNFTPKAGYFVTDKIAVGVELGFGQNKETSYSGPDNDIKNVASQNVFGAGVFGRYYFLELGSRFKTYTEVGVGYLSLTGEDKVGADPAVKDPKVNGFGANAGVGVNYFLTDKIAVNFAFGDVLSYGSLKVDEDGQKAVSSFNANINVFDNFFNTAQFGLTFKF